PLALHGLLLRVEVGIDFDALPLQAADELGGVVGAQAGQVDDAGDGDVLAGAGTPGRVVQQVAGHDRVAVGVADVGDLRPRHVVALEVGDLDARLQVAGRGAVALVLEDAEADLRAEVVGGTEVDPRHAAGAVQPDDLAAGRARFERVDRVGQAAQA